MHDWWLENVCNLHKYCNSNQQEHTYGPTCFSLHYMQVAIYTYNLATNFIFNCGILFITWHPRCYRHTLSHYHECCLPSTHHRGVEDFQVLHSFLTLLHVMRCILHIQLQLAIIIKYSALSVLFRNVLVTSASVSPNCLMRLCPKELGVSGMMLVFSSSSRAKSPGDSWVSMMLGWGELNGLAIDNA